MSPEDLDAALRPRATVRFAARTDVGRERERNEDAFAVLEADTAFVIADGMGGHAAGEVASRLAIEAIGELLASARDEDATWPSWMDPGRSFAENRLIYGIRTANARIYDAAGSDIGRCGMGSTVVAAHAAGDVMVIAHVGDSRAYLVRDGTIRRLTRDHTLLEYIRMARPDMTPEQVVRFQYKHVITRALGMAQEVEVDVDLEPIRSGDVFLLCSDGLSGMVEDQAMLEIIRQAGGDLERAADRLIEAANLAGGTDNITAILVACELET